LGQTREINTGAALFNTSKYRSKFILAHLLIYL
jgi:hypothetical protein